MSYKNRLDKLKKAWETDKPAEGSVTLPEGKYQFIIKSAKLVESTYEYNKGHLMVEIKVAVATGPLKGKPGTIRVDLEQPADESKGYPSGISRFKQYLTSLEINMPKSLSEADIKKTLENMIDVVFNGACVHNKNGYANIYINDLVHAGNTDSDDEDETEDDDEEDDDDEDDDEKSESSDDDDEDDEEDDDEDDDDEEEKPVKKSSEKKAPEKKEEKKEDKKSDKKKKPSEDDDDDDEDWDEDF